MGEITITVIDYEMGNIKSIKNAIEFASKAEFSDVLRKVYNPLYSSINVCIL